MHQDVAKVVHCGQWVEMPSTDGTMRDMVTCLCLLSYHGIVEAPTYARKELIVVVEPFTHTRVMIGTGQYIIATSVNEER